MLLLPFRPVGPPTLLLGYLPGVAPGQPLRRSHDAATAQARRATHSPPEAGRAEQAAGAFSQDHNERAGALTQASNERTGHFKPASSERPEASTQAHSERPKASTQASSERPGPPILDLEPRSTLPPLDPATTSTPKDLFSEAPPPPGRPRMHPEVHIDPRTVFKQRGRTRPEVRPSPAPLIADGPVADLVIVPQLPSFRASDQGIKAVVNYLRATQILAATKQVNHPDGSVGLELLPDVFVHQAFFDDGGAPAGPPCIAEGYLWFATKPAPLSFGPARESCLRLELVGARAPRPSEAFLARLHSILYLRPEVHALPHDPSRLRKPAVLVAAEPIPRFDVQER